METQIVDAVPTAKQEVKKKNYKWFVGIDVSKNELDFAVIHGGQLLLHCEIQNSKTGVRDVIARFKCEITGFRLANAFFCMEETGVYSNTVLSTLYRLKANVAAESPLKIKRSLGLLRGKDDKADAIRIATYASRNFADIILWRPRRPEINMLAQLITMRERLISVRNQITVPVKEQRGFTDGAIYIQLPVLCKDSSLAISADLVKIDNKINELITSDDRLKRLTEVIMSVQGVGIRTALYMIVCTDEFLKISCPNKFASFAGIAPFPQSSGNFTGRAKVSPIANKRMKCLLHICAVNSIKSNMELREFFDRKTAIQGKHKMAALNAVRNKLVHRIFACVREDRLFVKGLPARNAVLPELEQHLN